MLQYPDLSGFSEEERMQLMTVMKKAQVYFAIVGLLSVSRLCLIAADHLSNYRTPVEIRAAIRLKT